MLKAMKLMVAIVMLTIVTLTTIATPSYAAQAAQTAQEENVSESIRPFYDNGVLRSGDDATHRVLPQHTYILTWENQITSPAQVQYQLEDAENKRTSPSVSNLPALAKIQQTINADNNIKILLKNTSTINSFVTYELVFEAE